MADKSDVSRYYTDDEKRRFAPDIKKANEGSGYKSAVKLACVECMGMSYSEAKECETTYCPLWAVSNKIFNRS